MPRIRVDTLIQNNMWEPAKRLSKQLPEEDRAMILEGFAQHMAEVMKDQIQTAIKNQRYKSRWRPLKVGYRKAKGRHNLSTNIWEATGLLAKSISVWTRGSEVYVGIPHDKVYPQSKVPVYMVARYLEHGTSRMPARPLFRPMFDYLRKNISRYWYPYIESYYKGG